MLWLTLKAKKRAIEQFDMENEGSNNQHSLTVQTINQLKRQSIQMNRDTQFTNMLKEVSLKKTDKESRTSAPISISVKERAFDVSATSSSDQTSSIISSHDESKDSDHKSVHINL